MYEVCVTTVSIMTVVIELLVRMSRIERDVHFQAGSHNQGTYSKRL